MGNGDLMVSKAIPTRPTARMFYSVREIHSARQAKYRSLPQNKERNLSKHQSRQEAARMSLSNNGAAPL